MECSGTLLERHYAQGEFIWSLCFHRRELFDPHQVMMHWQSVVARQSRACVPRQIGRTLVSRSLLPSLRTSPVRLRLLSSTSGTTAAAGSSSQGLAISVGVALVGLGSYYAGSSHSSSVATTTTYGAAAPPPVYGTQEDFKRAIKELEATLGDLVSMDPADLSTHGFSPNVMHEGERRQCAFILLLTFLMLTRQTDGHRCIP
jgi:hypothetical protein